MAGIKEAQISAITGKLANRHHASAARQASEAKAETKEVEAAKLT